MERIEKMDKDEGEGEEALFFALNGLEILTSFLDG